MIKDIIFEQGYEAISAIDHDNRVQDIVLQIMLVESGQFDAAKTEIIELEELVSETRDERDELQEKLDKVKRLVASGNIKELEEFLDV